MKKLSIPRLTAFTGLLAALLFFGPLAAQPPAARRVTGKITAQTNGNPVPGASITVKGTRNFVQADADGAFTIMAAPNEILVVTNVGYAVKEVKVGNAQTLTIELAQDYNNLNDVIVVGDGKIKKNDLSSAV